ncbi:MAG: c-type cytochrome [Deltaproteobacteria bacterium]|jgi:DNA-binding beta-propeller fold protein YncE/mono/diheme cytochrome c family protein
MQRIGYASVLALGLATACGDGLSDARYPTGSNRIATSSDYRALYVTNTDHGTVSTVKTEGLDVSSIDVGGEPTRIVRVDEKVFVTLRLERAIAVLEETDDGLVFLETIKVGAEPYGIVAPEGGDHVYVAVQLENKVLEIETDTHEISNEWNVPDQPRWLTMHPNGDDLFVASAMNGTFTHIDVGEDGVADVPLPRINTGLGPRGVRVMGDPAISSDGYYIAVPTMNIDSETPIDDTGSIPPTGYYGGRQDFTVALIPVEGGEPDLKGTRLIGLSDPVGGPSGYASSVAFDPEGFKLYATLEGSNRVLVMDVEGEKGADGGILFEVFGDSNFEAGFFTTELRPTAIFDAPDGANAVTFVDDEEAFVYGFLDRAVARIDVSSVKQVSEFGQLSAPKTLGIGTVAGPAFSAEVEEGRRLFYTNDTPTIANPLTGLSCATCHFDGRNDGVSWTFVRGKRQTPSLAGRVSLTAPVRWEGDRETVAIDAQRTSRDAMGGTNMSDRQADLIELYIDSTRDVDVAMGASSDPAIGRGREIFQREDVGCASCHNGERMTDNESYEMFGLFVQTRSLIGVASSPPYLHDGSAETLRDVVLRSRSGEMGDTSMLSEQEIDDLVAYLSAI